MQRDTPLVYGDQVTDRLALFNSHHYDIDSIMTSRVFSKRCLELLVDLIQLVTGGRDGKILTIEPEQLVR